MNQPTKEEIRAENIKLITENRRLRLKINAVCWIAENLSTLASLNCNVEATQKLSDVANLLKGES